MFQRILLYLLVLLLFASLLQAKTIDGKVVKIADGDTFTLLTTAKEQFRVRLLHIDCPENGQPFGKIARHALSTLIYNKQVKVYYDKRDRYKRILGNVYLGNLYVNMEMVKMGYAWHFKKYSVSPAFEQEERNARSRKLGLWVDLHPVAPWVWRKMIHKKNPQ